MKTPLRPSRWRQHAVPSWLVTKSTAVCCLVLTLVLQVFPSYKLLWRATEPFVRVTSLPTAAYNGIILKKRFSKPTGRLEHSRKPDYGDLQFEALNEEFFQRNIKKSTENQTNLILEDSGAPKAERDCEPSKWNFVSYPTCNAFHEVAQERGDLRILGAGHYRMAWLVRPSPDETFVLKQLKLVMDPNDFDRAIHNESLSMVQHEAIVMERLTASPRIADIYGACGVSLYVQTLHSTVEPIILAKPPDGFWGSLLQQARHSLQAYGSRNRLSSIEKLDLVTTMAEAVADMHGCKGGVIINSDIAAVQFLFDAQGNVRLNDFNIAAFPDWNEKENKYCKVDRPRWDGRLYAPEQYRGEPIDKQVDVYALGNLIYMTLTGRWPLYEIADHEDVRSSILRGIRPSIDTRRANFIEQRLIEIMRRMWAPRPSDRPEIFEVVSFLRKTRELYHGSH